VDIQQLQSCGDLMRNALMTDPMATIFGFCVWVLQVIGDFTGWGYQLANIIVFIIVQPGLILLFFVLWRRTRKEALVCQDTGRLQEGTIK